MDLKSLMKQTGGEGTGKPVSSPLSFADRVRATRIEPDKSDTQKPRKFYFHSERPNMGVFISSTLRIKFRGNYFETEDVVVADYLRQHYGHNVTEITEDQRTDGHTYKG